MKWGSLLMMAGVIVAVFGGIGFIMYGIEQIHPPSAAIVLGVVILLAVVGALIYEPSNKIDR